MTQLNDIEEQLRKTMTVRELERAPANIKELNNGVNFSVNGKWYQLVYQL